jgi:hypothetical protein
VGLVGYARIQTDLDGKIFKVEEITGINERDSSFIVDSIDSIVGDILDEKDCDLLVTINIDCIECGSYESREYDDVISFPNVIILRRGYKEILKKEIIDLDKWITDWEGEPDFVGCTEFVDKDGAKGALYDMHDDYLHAYGEGIEIKN